MAYSNNKDNTSFPFWAKLWPASFALCHFIEDHSDWVTNKKVLELAAGLGLPSLYVSEFAMSVHCSDYNKDAVALISENIKLNGISNMIASKIDWNQLPEDIDSEIILMSDVNYDPDDFDRLFQLIHRLLEKGNTILLSTPQRLVGKAFITALLPFCQLNEERWHDQVAINILVLKK